MKTTQENGTIFTELTTEQLESLRNIEAEKFVISNKSIQTIRKILNIDEADNKELSGMRNSIVQKFSTELNKEDIESTFDTMTRISMITAVIDDEKTKRGMGV